MENARFGRLRSQFLGKYSWKTLGLKDCIRSFCESLVENARFWAASFSFFCAGLLENARFGSLPSQFLGKLRRKRSFWKCEKTGGGQGKGRGWKKQKGRLPSVPLGGCTKALTFAPCAVGRLHQCLREFFDALPC